MTTIPVPRDLLQAIANYLAGRPYREVVEMIDALRLLPPSPAPPPVESPTATAADAGALRA